MRPRNRGKFNHNYFESIDSERKSYWLGFLMADGVVSDRAKRGALQLHVHLGTKDRDHLQKFHIDIESKNKIANCSSSIRSFHSSDKMCEDLIRHGCTPRKSLTLKYPTTVPIELTGHFVRGYFDGDGSATIIDGRLFLQIVGTF